MHNYEVYLAEWSRASIFSLLEVAGSNPGSRKFFFPLAKISYFVRFINKVHNSLHTAMKTENWRKK